MDNDGVQAAQSISAVLTDVDGTLVTKDKVLTERALQAVRHLRGIERRIDAGLRPDVASVASVFVSRWDSAVAGKVPAELRSRLKPELAELAPKGHRRMSDNPHTNGGLLLRDLKMPDFRDYAVKVPKPGAVTAESTRAMGTFLRDVMKLNLDARNFRVFSPDENNSNRWQDVLEVTNRCYVADILPEDDHLAPDGRVMEVLSEHQCQGWLEGYLLTGRHGFFSCYEAFIHIIDSMFNQHAKWLKVCNHIPWRRPVGSLNYLLSSHVWRQDNNGFSHQDPGFIDHVVNVVDLMKLQPPHHHPHGLPDHEFDALFTTDKPVIFAFHGYPSLIHRLTYRRNGHRNLHVRGYQEEGTTTTPFDMVVLNELDRFSLVNDVIDRVPQLAPRSAYAKQAIRLRQAGDPRQAAGAQAIHRQVRRRPARNRRLEMEPSRLHDETRHVHGRGQRLGRLGQRISLMEYVMRSPDNVRVRRAFCGVALLVARARRAGPIDGSTP